MKIEETQKLMTESKKFVEKNNSFIKEIVKKVHKENFKLDFSFLMKKDMMLIKGSILEGRKLQMFKDAKSFLNFLENFINIDEKNPDKKNCDKKVQELKEIIKCLNEGK